MNTTAYIVYYIEAGELDEVVTVILAHELEAAKAHYASLQDGMSMKSAFIIRPIKTGLAGYFTGRDITFYGNKKD
jgi:hypothetical protein